MILGDCKVCGGPVGPDYTGRPMCYYCGPKDMIPTRGAPMPGIIVDEFKDIPQKVLDQVDEYLGKKFDQGKPNWSLMPWASLQEVQAVLDYGAKKYGEHNWKYVLGPKARYLSAMLRHVIAYARGEQCDPESGYHHLAHAICCGLFIIHFEVTRVETSP